MPRSLARLSLALLAASAAALTPRAPEALNQTESALAQAWAHDLLSGKLERPDGRHGLTLCAVATAPETRFIDEWIVTHALLGVGRFIIYDTSFTTELQAALQRWMDAGLVTLVHPSFAACVRTDLDAAEAADPGWSGNTPSRACCDTA